MTTVTDAWGDAWDVTEARPTRHGFDVLIGYPAGVPRGKGGAGGKRVIVTPELATHFEAFRAAGGKRLGGTLDLPIGVTTIKRVRKLLGHHYQVDQAVWWEARADDLADLTVEACAAKHGRSVGAVARARLALFGPRLRPYGWWRQPDVAAILLRDAPAVDAAEALDISPSSVRRLRSVLREVPLSLIRGCVHPGCDRTDIAGRGLCWKHYQRARREGTLGIHPKSACQPAASDEERRERQREYRRRYIEAHPDRVLDAAARYRAANAERQREYFRARHAKKRGDQKPMDEYRLKYGGDER